MKSTDIIFTLLLLTIFGACRQDQKIDPENTSRSWLTGNPVEQFIPDNKDSRIYRDPVDDTLNFRHIIDNIYQDASLRTFIKTVCFDPSNSDSIVYLEYFKDMTNFLDLKSYKQLKEGFFQNKGKVYMWWGNSDGDYAVTVKGADPLTFSPFDSVAGGTDLNHVFYGGPPVDFEIIEGANPKTIRVLNPDRDCWNCGDCYFVDDKHVFYGFKAIPNADPKTFRLLNKDSIDAIDKFGKYFEGQRIN